MVSRQLRRYDDTRRQRRIIPHRRAERDDVVLGAPRLRGRVRKLAYALFAYFDQVLGAVNAMRAASGQGALTWAQALVDAGYGDVPVPAQNGLIRGKHLLALRNAMNSALGAVQVGAPGYTDSLATPTPFRALHIRELQQRAQ